MIRLLQDFGDSVGDAFMDQGSYRWGSSSPKNTKPQGNKKRLKIKNPEKKLSEVPVISLVQFSLVLWTDDRNEKKAGSPNTLSL